MSRVLNPALKGFDGFTAPKDGPSFSVKTLEHMLLTQKKGRRVLFRYLGSDGFSSLLVVRISDLVSNIPRLDAEWRSSPVLVRDSSRAPLASKGLIGSNVFSSEKWLGDLDPTGRITWFLREMEIEDLERNKHDSMMTKPAWIHDFSAHAMLDLPLPIMMNDQLFNIWLMALDS